MLTTGIIEGFFGPKWNDQSRFSYASFLKEHGGDFYIYAPKQDQFLRKKWRETWPESYQVFLKTLATHFAHHGIKFGVGFSPFELGTELSEEDKNHLETKLKMMSNLGIEIMGLFFDDMPTNEYLAKAQIETINLFKKHFTGKIVFCPSYYTPDPILDKVFGQRPANYLKEIADGVPSDVSIAWTGPKVISLEIPFQHLQETTELLKRPPFLWENLYANDGPKNCKYLKLRYFSGREPKALRLAEACGFNMMNQPELSKIVYLSSLYVLTGMLETDAFEKAVRTLCSKEFSDFLILHRLKFLDLGLDQIETEEKMKFIEILKSFMDPGAEEVIDWLDGKFIVGTECLTD